MNEEDFEPYPEKMERLSAAEANRYKAALSSWVELSDANLSMQKIWRKAQLYAVAQGELKFWRELFVAMSCAYLTHALRVKLGADPPDFLLDYGTHEKSFELVQIVPANCRISGDHKTHAENLNKTGSTTFKILSFEQGREEYEAFAADLEKSIEAKCNKYDDKTMILVADVAHAVYFDIDTNALRTAAKIAHRKLKWFSEIWIRKENYILRVSPQSVSMIKEPWPTDD